MSFYLWLANTVLEVMNFGDYGLGVFDGSPINIYDVCFESAYYFAETESVRYKLIVLQRRRASIRLPRLAVDDFNHTVTR